MTLKNVVFKREVVDSIFSYSEAAYPREGILLLRGRKRKDVLEVESVVIPPFATHGHGFSSFDWTMLPVDPHFVGVAHSHPSGYAIPSHEDLLHATGSIMVIAGYPYHDDKSLGVYNARGEPLPFEIK